MRWWGWIAGICAGCGPTGMVAPYGTTSTSSSSGGGDTSTTSSAGESTTLVPADTSSSSSASSSSSDDGALFIVDPDGGVPVNECDVWKEDCPRGMKCMPWASHGGTSWDAYRCSALARDPAQVGETCTVEGNGVSGIDDCDLHSMCWYVDGDTNMGECVGFCTGSRANPICLDGKDCWITGAGILILCLAECDPLLQDCSEGEACYPQNDLFECEPDNSGDAGAVGDPCVNIDECDPGRFCASADVLPSCPSTSCCAAFCDITDPEASTACNEDIAGTACVPWFEPGQAPPGYEATGMCVLP